MNRERITDLLKRFRDGSASLEEALEQLHQLPYEDVGFARIDHHRSLRWGFPEVVFCQGKTPFQVAVIAQKLSNKGSNFLGTRAGRDIFDEVKTVLPEAVYNETARTITHVQSEIVPIPGNTLIVTAGTSDLPVAEECLVTAGMLGLDVSLIADIGVAGIHRLFDRKADLDRAEVIIVTAGMEGALASVVAGMVSVPVIAVPTSIGYGASFGGITPLLSMLNSCVPGTAVVNIDNGFGAAFLAFRILKNRPGNAAS